MPRLKVMTLVGTRPEIIKLSRVIAALEQHTEHLLVHSGQNYDYELNQIFFDELNIRRPDVFLNAAGAGPAETIGRTIMAADEVFAAHQPDALLVYGDTNTCLAAIAAKRRKIPIFHMEAGNRCFDQRVPEEINRKIIDHISDINLPLTEHARRYLLAEGLRPETIIKTGSTMGEVLAHYLPHARNSQVLERLGLEAGRYFVVSAHREENVDALEQLQGLIASINALADEFQMPVVLSLHPRTRNRFQASGYDPTQELSERVIISKPFGFYDYIRLQLDAFCVLSDSGTLTEESSLLDFPAVMLRSAHERPEGMDEGTTIMSCPRQDRVLDAVRVVVGQQPRGQRAFRLIEDYEPLNVSQKVVRIILSYVDYVNRTVWQKPVTSPEPAALARKALAS